MQVAEPGLAWGIQSVLLAALLIALFARLTPRRLRHIGQVYFLWSR